MNKIDLKDHVRRAIRSEWNAFAQEHPLLSQAMKEDVLVEEATKSIADDPEYQTVMTESQSAGIGAEAIITFVERFIAAWMKRLL